MKTFKFPFSIKASTQTEAQAKLKALSKLAHSTDLKTLQALSERGPALISDPQFGPVIRQFLGMA